VLAFGGPVTVGSVTTGAAVTMVEPGGVVSTSRVVVSVTVRSVLQLDIQPNDRPTQVAKAMLVMIFIVVYPLAFRSEGIAPEPRGKNGVGLCIHGPLAHPPNYCKNQQSACRSCGPLKSIANKAFPLFAK